MAVKMFVDDSGGKGHGKHFALVGLVAESESREAFSGDWAACLREHPKISLLKMRDAAALRGEFSLWPSQARDEKLRTLAQVINRHVKFVIWTVIDMDAHAQAWAKKPKPQNAEDLYAWCIRRNTDSPDEQSFEWLLSELGDVSKSDYANYYDLDRMLSVEKLSLYMVVRNEVPQDLLDLHHQLGIGRSKKR